MAECPAWIQPGLTATLIWYDGVGEARGGDRLYQVAGPVLEPVPASPYFLLAPLERSAFAGRLYRAEVSLADLRAFLGDLDVAEGHLSDELEFVATRRRAPLLPVLDAWGETAPAEVLPYLSDLNAFLPSDSGPLFVTPEAHAGLQREPERFGTAWICDGCGEAEDASVFLWTTHRDGFVHVRLAIENQGGVWTCRLHPFKFPREESHDG